MLSAWGQVRIIPIESIDDPRLDVYRNQKDAWLRAGHNPEATERRSRRSDGGGGSEGGGVGRGAVQAGAGLFMAEGVLVVGALLESGVGVESVLGTREQVWRVEALIAERAPETPVFVASREVLAGVVGFDLHRGLLAAGRRAGDGGLGCSIEAVIERSRVLVLGEDLANHDNVGGLMRTVAGLAGDAGGVLLSPRCCDPLYRKALRVSMGNALRVAWAQVGDAGGGGWLATLDRVAAAGFRLVALSPGGGVSVRTLGVGRGERVALLVGAEGAGLEARTLVAVDRLGGVRAAIPMAGGVDSLNVVVALGIALDRIVDGRDA
ncbi:MAG: RNA methyltransferase [Phycisphaerales bacterium]